MRNYSLTVFCIGLLTLTGCTKSTSGTSQASGGAAAGTQPDSGGEWHRLAPANAGVPRTDAVPSNSTAPASAPQIGLSAGTSFRVRLQETLDTRRNRAGDRFAATLDEPLVDGDRVVVPKGTVFSGRVTAAKPSGRFKGRAVLELTLESFTLNGREYRIRSNDAGRVSAGHTKHNFAWIGGGSGGGALIGGAAAGGEGALIGAGAGAAAGTLGSVFTGKREVTLPAETTLRFTLKSAVPLG